MIWEELRDIWLGLPRAAGASAPMLDNLSAASITPIVTHCWRLRRAAWDRYIVEHVGEYATTTWGEEPTGRNIFDFASESEKMPLIKAYETILTKPCGLVRTREMPKGIGGFYRLTTGSFPFADREGEVSIIVGSFEMEQVTPEARFSGSFCFDSAQVTEDRFIDLGAGVPRTDCSRMNAGVEYWKDVKEG